MTSISVTKSIIFIKIIFKPCTRDFLLGMVSPEFCQLYFYNATQINLISELYWWSVILLVGIAVFSLLEWALCTIFFCQACTPLQYGSLLKISLCLRPKCIFDIFVIKKIVKKYFLHFVRAVLYYLNRKFKRTWKLTGKYSPSVPRPLWFCSDWNTLAIVGVQHMQLYQTGNKFLCSRITVADVLWLF